MVIELAQCQAGGVFHNQCQLPSVVLYSTGAKDVLRMY